MDDSHYFHRRAKQSLDRAAHTTEPARSIHLDLARRYTECWRQACDEDVEPRPARTAL